MGWAVSDDQTWAWRLQELRPDLEVVNHGVGGYGTLQSSMLLDEVLRREERERPGRVLYGFIDHAGRNIASPLWLWALSFNTRAAATPYCTLTPEGRLERHPPEAYPSFPFHEQLALVALLEKSWLDWRARPRAGMGPAVTQRLISEMAERCRAAGVGFSLVMLHLPDAKKAVYAAYARDHGIDVIDCNQPRYDPVPWDPHPNAAAHHRWGDCIAAALAAPGRLPPGPGPQTRVSRASAAPPASRSDREARDGDGDLVTP